MVVITSAEIGTGVEIRGKIGSPATYGTRVYGAHDYGAGADLFGIWQIRTRFGKRVQVREKFYTPSNPQTGPQQAWRAIFTAGVNAWQLLSEEGKQTWREDAKYKNLTGFNLFMREYLNENK